MNALRTTADGSKTLYSSRYDQTFHSDRGAVTESRHVFLGGAGVAARLAAGRATRVLEVGFGTGLNFFLTADAALAADTPLSYVALEHELLTSEVIAALEYPPHLRCPAVVTAFLGWRAALPRRPRGLYPFEHRGVGLTLHLGEATETRLNGTFDAIYHDAFSPDANPELWTEPFLRTLYHALKDDGLLGTYSVKGEVRRRLSAVGFAPTKQPGPPGGKREMLVARKVPAE